MLRAMFDLKREDDMPALLDYVVTDWGGDPFSCGAYSYARVGSDSRDIRALASAEHGDACVSPAACSVEGAQCVHGAVATGQEAAAARCSRRAPRLARDDFLGGVMGTHAELPPDVFVACSDAACGCGGACVRAERVLRQRRDGGSASKQIERERAVKLAAFAAGESNTWRCGDARWHAGPRATGARRRRSRTWIPERARDAASARLSSPCTEGDPGRDGESRVRGNAAVPQAHAGALDDDMLAKAQWLHGPLRAPGPDLARPEKFPAARV